MPGSQVNQNRPRFSCETSSHWWSDKLLFFYQMIQTQAKLACLPVCPSLPIDDSFESPPGFIVFLSFFSSVKVPWLIPRPLYCHQLPPISFMSFLHLPQSSPFSSLLLNLFFFFQTHRLWQRILVRSSNFQGVNRRICFCPPCRCSTLHGLVWLRTAHVHWVCWYSLSLSSPANQFPLGIPSVQDA